VPNSDEQAIPRDVIERFARTISGQPLGLAKYAPEPWADIRLCFENARRKAEQDGGQARFGWMFQHKLVEAIPGLGYLIAIHHAVWRAPSGYLFDVTPLHPTRKIIRSPQAEIRCSWSMILRSPCAAAG
jgi:hypothetical protein